MLVFDEATSALDTLTEQAVMEAVNALSQQKTLILIAHRLSTVRDCDQIFLLEHGRLVGRGRYDERVQHNERFRAMATGQRGDFPQAERYYREAISLPLYPGLAEAEQDFVVERLRAILERR